MTLIRAKNISVEFPIYGGGSNRSLKKALLNTVTGGILAKDAADHVVVKALDDLSFEFHEGDRIGLVGHNGSGKSTLLRVLAGIYEPICGQIEVRGRVTSMLNISLGMDLEASGYNNIYMIGYVMGMHPSKMRPLIDDIADFTGLGNFLHLPMRTYSSGMQMRLAFAVATSVEADIILMDEWLSVGDADFVKKAKSRLDAMVNSARIVVLASHSTSLIESQCNKVVFLEHGKIKCIKEYQKPLEGD